LSSSSAIASSSSRKKSGGSVCLHFDSFSIMRTIIQAHAANYSTASLRREQVKQIASSASEQVVKIVHVGDSDQAAMFKTVKPM
jgi:hypothetical protein